MDHRSNRLVCAPPPIHFVMRSELANLHGSPEDAALEVQPLYDPSRGLISLLQEGRPDGLRQATTMLHELVHHAQRSNNVVLPAWQLTSGKHTNCRSNGCGNKGRATLRSDQNE